MVPLPRIGSTFLVVALLLVDWGCGAAGSAQPVVTWRVPDGGRLPRAVIDAGGTVHMVYVRGDATRGDLMYVTRTKGASAWSEPMAVNSEPGTVTGIGPIDGGQLALGRDGRVHVAWLQINPIEFFYTRTRTDGTGFEPQFGVAAGSGVEAGPSITADRAGNVFLFWHEGTEEDARRSVYLAVSRDDGTVFEPVRPVNSDAEGACNCCGLRALSDDAGRVYVSYRGAGDNVRRGQRLLTSNDAGLTFADELIQPWNVGACPVSTTSLSEGPSGMTVAWETQGQVYFAPVDDLGNSVLAPGVATIRRKNPTVAVNHGGQTLLAWGDGPGFRTGGTLHWRVFEAGGHPTAEQGSGTETIPDQSVPIALARADGTFLVIF